MSWRIHGSYFESCNCDAICPCRRIDSVAGGRSTHGICLGVLSWLIEEGAAEQVDLSGLPVAIASHYSDDEPGSPWTWILYLADRASPEQRDALEAIFTGGSVATPTAISPGRGSRAPCSPYGLSRSRSTTPAGGSGCGSATTSACRFATATPTSTPSRA